MDRLRQLDSSKVINCKYLKKSTILKYLIYLNNFSHLPTNKSLANGVYACTCENCGHFFKFRAIQDFKSTATFTINGTQYTGYDLLIFLYIDVN